MVEIRDLDQWFHSEEVVGAVAAETGINRDALKVVSVRKRFGGTQSATVLVPSAACQKMLAHGRIEDKVFPVNLLWTHAAGNATNPAGIMETTAVVSLNKSLSQ